MDPANETRHSFEASKCNAQLSHSANREVVGEKFCATVTHDVRILNKGRSSQCTGKSGPRSSDAFRLFVNGLRLLARRRICPAHLNGGRGLAWLSRSTQVRQCTLICSTAYVFCSILASRSFQLLKTLAVSRSMGRTR
jgi:hypothetical protein